MTDTAATVARIADLKRKLKARTGMDGYRDNRKALKAEIARLEATLPPDIYDQNDGED